MQKTSRVTHGLIRHRLLEDARSTFSPMCMDATDGLVLLLVGPTQSGKSIVFHEIVCALHDAFRDPHPGTMPVVDLQIETVSDGRAKPKWLGIELLRKLEHPVYRHIGCFDEDQHYFPAKARDEGTLRIALKEAFNARCARRVCLDELHLLTRTKDADLRASILESIKSTCAIDRTLIGCGGYEIAYKGLFDSPHFCGRVIVIDFDHYSVEKKDDVKAWISILKTYGPHMRLSPDTLLLDTFEDLIWVTNGVIGLLDKMLWRAQWMARAKGCSINRNILLSSAPPEDERRAVAKDIERGKAALKASQLPERKVKRTDTVDPQRKSDRRPFERKPNRGAAMDVDLYVDD